MNKYKGWSTTVLILLLLSACAIGQSAKVKLGERSTVDILIRDTQGNPIPNALFVVVESGFRYVVPLPWQSPAWTAQGKEKQYSSDESGKIHLEFRDSVLTLVKLKINNKDILPLSMANNTPGTYYRVYENKWWSDLIVKGNNRLEISKGYAPNTKELLGHRYEIVIVNSVN